MSTAIQSLLFCGHTLRKPVLNYFYAHGMEKTDTQLLNLKTFQSILAENCASRSMGNKLSHDMSTPLAHSPQKSVSSQGSTGMILL